MNLVTEDEAVVIRCCVRALTIRGNCIGEGCMAWRWAREKEPLTTEQMRAARTAVGVARALQPDREPRRGYCGRAGQP